MKEVAEAIQNATSAKSRTELCMQRFLYVQKRDETMMKLAEKENKLRELEEQRKEWQLIQKNVRSLRNDLFNPNYDEELKQEIRKEIEGLSKRKVELANLLGYK